MINNFYLIEIQSENKTLDIKWISSLNCFIDREIFQGDIISFCDDKFQGKLFEDYNTYQFEVIKRKVVFTESYDKSVLEFISQLHLTIKPILKK